MPSGTADATAPAPVRALLFLYAASLRNRLRQQRQRLRRPRYLAAVALGGFYLWWALIRNARVGTSAMASLLSTEGAQVIGGVLLLLYTAQWWLLEQDRGALAYSPAEVTFLFPAPITRRTLVQARLLRLQLAILVNTLLFSVLLRGGAGSVAAWQRGLALWMLFSTLSLHRLGASIVRRSTVEHGARGVRRHLPAFLIYGALLAAVAYGLVISASAIQSAGTAGLRALVGAVRDALMAPIPALALTPMRALLEPLSSAGSDRWGAAIAVASAILLGHYLWVLRLDRAFEEAALEASQHRVDRLQKMRAAQLGETRTRRGALIAIPPLPRWGPPEIAIAWKNVAAALRGGSWRRQLIMFVFLYLVIAVVAPTDSVRGADAFLGITLGWGAMLLILGPIWLRFDLRLDLQRLDQLRTLPLPGWRIVTAEIAAVTALHTLTLWTVLAVPAGMAAVKPGLFLDRGALLPVTIAVALGVPLVNALLFTIHNGMALLFPAWVRLGGEPRGFEVIGQNLLTTGATSLVAAVALVFPLGTALLVRWVAPAWNGWSLVAATLAGGALLLLELWPMLRWLGSVFERTESSEVAVTASIT